MKLLSVISKLAIFIGIVIILGIFGYAIFGNRVIIKKSPLIASEAPNFTLDLFNGDKIKLSELRGKAVLLNFWASWCIPCRDEAPALESSWLKYKDKPVVFLGVNIWDDDSNAISYLRTYNGGYPNGKDPAGDITVNYGVAGVPETYFIDTTGKITDKYVGPLTVDIIDHFLSRALLNSDHEVSYETDN